MKRFLAGGAVLLVILAYLNAPVMRGLFSVPFSLSGFRPAAFLLNAAASIALFALAAAYLVLLWIQGDAVWCWMSGGGEKDGGKYFALGCGLAAFSLALLGLGLAGLFYPSAVGVPLVLLAVFSRPRRTAAGLLGAVRKADWRSAAWGLPLLPAVPCILAGPLLPPTNVDTLAAHLGLPSLWGLSHRIFPAPGNPHFGYPMGFERLSAFFLGLGQEGGVPAFHILLLGVSGLAYSAALRRAGFRLSACGGWLVASCGCFLALSWEGHPDMGMVFAVALGIFAFAGGSTMGLGAACAVAATCKYTGLLAAVAFLLSAPLLRRGTARNLRAVAGASAVLLAASSGWMVRNWLETGNPVYPFARGLFPSLNWEAWNSTVLWNCMPHASIDFRWFATRGFFRDLAPVFWKASQNGWFSPLTVLFYLLPFSLFFGGSRFVKAVSAQGVLFSLAWLFPAAKFGRYLMPELPVPLLVFLVLLGGAGTFRRLMLGLMVFLWGASFVSAVRGHAVPPERVLAGAADREAYGRAEMGGYRAAVEWINSARLPRGRVLVIGGSAGYGLKRPWMWADDASVPAFLLAAGEKAGPERVRAGFRQKGVGAVLYNPVAALHRSRWAEGYVLSERWMSGYAAAWRKYMLLARTPDVFDGSGGWYVYGFHSSPGFRPPPAAPRPWVPGLERITYDEDAFARGAADPRMLALQGKVMGDFGVAHYQRALGLAVAGDGARAVEEMRRAVDLGMDTPWVRVNAAILLSSLGRREEALRQAGEALRMSPGDGKAKWLISRLGKGARGRP